MTTIRKPRIRPMPAVSDIKRKIDSLVVDMEKIKAVQDLHKDPSDEDDSATGQVASIKDFRQAEAPPQIPASNRKWTKAIPTCLRMADTTSTEALLYESSSNGWPQVVLNGDLSPAQAYQAFDHFTTNMLKHFPVVVFPPGTTACSVRQQQPVLFLSILNAASGLFSADLQGKINQELLGIFADLTLVVGIKSLELIKALQIGTIWYYAPPRYRDLKYYQLIHCASIMAIDMGINRRRPVRLKPKIGLAEPPQGRGHAALSPAGASDSMEARRAWLGCYFTSAQTAQNLRRENLIRWTPYLAECMHILETSSEAAPSDNTLCQWIRYQHLADDIGTQFSVADPSSGRNLDDVGLQYTIRSFEQQIDEHVTAAGLQTRPVALELAEAFTGIYLHEVALHSGSTSDDMQPPFTEEVLATMKPTGRTIPSATHIKCLSDCLTNIYSMLDTFLSISVEDLRCQPVFQFVRVMYVLVVLVKINLGTSTQEPPNEEIATNGVRKIHAYINQLIERLHHAAEGDQCASAAKFGLVISSLKKCFEKLSESSELKGQPALVLTEVPESSFTENRGFTTNGYPPNLMERSAQYQSYSHETVSIQTSSTASMPQLMLRNPNGVFTDFSTASWLGIDSNPGGYGSNQFDNSLSNQMDDEMAWIFAQPNQMDFQYPQL